MIENTISLFIFATVHKDNVIFTYQYFILEKESLQNPSMVNFIGNFLNINPIIRNYDTNLYFDTSDT